MNKLFILLLLVVSVAHADDVRFRKYGTATTVTFGLRDEADATDLLGTATFASGDCIIKKDQGTGANCTNLPAVEGNNTFSIALTAAEMQADIVDIILIDQTGTQVWADKNIVVETTDDGNGNGLFVAQNVTVGDIVQAALAKFVNTDTGESSATTGSVASFGGGGGSSRPTSPGYVSN